MKRDERRAKRQGDVLIVPIGEDDVTVVSSWQIEEGRTVLAFGEATGHAHAIYDRTTESVRTANDELFLRVVEPTEVRHEEHAPVPLEPGLWRVVRQREYDESDRRWDFVAD